VRGLLCYTCNKALGWWEGDPVASHNAALYLSDIAASYGDGYDPLPRSLVEPGSKTDNRVHLPAIQLKRAA